MDLEFFFVQLQQLCEKIDCLLRMIHNDKIIIGERIETFWNYLETIIPHWIYFIEQSQIGEVEYLNSVLSDLEYGIRRDDVEYFMDTLYNGMEDLATQYIELISEVIYE